MELLLPPLLSLSPWLSLSLPPPDELELLELLVLVFPPSLETLLLELELLPKPKLQLPAKAPVDQAAALKIAMKNTNFLMTLSFGSVTARAPPSLSASIVSYLQ